MGRAEAHSASSTPVIPRVTWQLLDRWQLEDSTGDSMLLPGSRLGPSGATVGSSQCDNRKHFSPTPALDASDLRRPH